MTNLLKSNNGRLENILKGEGKKLTDLLNKKVEHERFGVGNVINCDDSYIKIRFPSGDKKFVFPDAFKKYLTINDKSAAALVKEKLKEREKEREKEKIQLKKKREEKALRRAQLRMMEKQKSARRSVHSNAQSVFWCKPEELEDIFTDWQIFTGRIKSGVKKGQPRILARMRQNSACLITEREADIEEKDRQILGVFMTKMDFNGRECEEGYIDAHPKYRIKLSSEEADQMPFWKYYKNNRYPESIVWNSGRQRYFANKWMAQILRDIADLRKGTEEEELAQEFLEYFCRINNIELEELPEPAGALVEIENQE